MNVFMDNLVIFIFFSNRQTVLLLKLVHMMGKQPPTLYSLSALGGRDS